MPFYLRPRFILGLLPSKSKVKKYCKNPTLYIMQSLFPEPIWIRIET